MTVKEFGGMSHSPVEVRSGYNGKLLCKSYNEKKHVDLSDREIISVWSEIRCSKVNGFGDYANSVICIFVYGDKEAADGK